MTTPVPKPRLELVRQEPTASMIPPTQAPKPSPADNPAPVFVTNRRAVPPPLVGAAIGAVIVIVLLGTLAVGLVLGAVVGRSDDAQLTILAPMPTTQGAEALTPTGPLARPPTAAPVAPEAEVPAPPIAPVQPALAQPASTRVAAPLPPRVEVADAVAPSPDPEPKPGRTSAEPSEDESGDGVVIVEPDVSREDVPPPPPTPALTRPAPPAPAGPDPASHAGMWQGRGLDRPLTLQLALSPSGSATGTIQRRVGAREVTGAVAGTWRSAGDGVQIELRETDAPRPVIWRGQLSGSQGSGQVVIGGKERGTWTVSR